MFVIYKRDCPCGSCCNCKVKWSDHNDPTKRTKTTKRTLKDYFSPEVAVSHRAHNDKR